MYNPPLGISWTAAGPINSCSFWITIFPSLSSWQLQPPSTTCSLQMILKCERNLLQSSSWRLLFLPSFSSTGCLHQSRHGSAAGQNPAKILLQPPQPHRHTFQKTLPLEHIRIAYLEDVRLNQLDNTYPLTDHSKNHFGRNKAYIEIKGLKLEHMAFLVLPLSPNSLSS